MTQIFMFLSYSSLNRMRSYIDTICSKSWRILRLRPQFCYLGEELFELKTTTATNVKVHRMAYVYNIITKDFVFQVDSMGWRIVRFITCDTV